eukprot:TRINITY_DN9476_c0_g1_i1.p1 TRINITY_DN9476_c0_g1~~TRINITY_DN9476_c0_g1_i1.p1  ORF type:complete len:680 (-),score=204.20 TRINITY_DN9476_c0_g1_i1:427-2466(-)
MADGDTSGTESLSEATASDYVVVLGTKRGACEAEGCTGCEVFQIADVGIDGAQQEGGPCVRCGHFPHDHRNCGADVEGDAQTLQKIDPLGLLAEDGATTEKELESRKKLETMCEWAIDGRELRFLDRLGSGKSAKVYKGLYRGEPVAIKVLKPLIEDKQISNFKKELDVMSAMTSPYVVKFFGGCLAPKVCLVMEYCENGSLYHLLQRKDYDITWPTYFRLAKEILIGVRDLHSMEPPIVHRDLKSLNLLVDKNYSVKVCDFGLSRFTEGENTDTLQKLRGTYAYSAPEVYFGEKYSTKSDVFSVGVILWELTYRTITGEYLRPYKEFPKIKIDFHIIINSAKKGLRPTIPAQCPEGIAEVIRNAWSATAEERVEADAMLQRIEEIERGYQGEAQKWEPLRTPAVKIEQTSEGFQKKSLDAIYAQMAAEGAGEAAKDTSKEGSDKKSDKKRVGRTSSAKRLRGLVGTKGEADKEREEKKKKEEPKVEIKMPETGEVHWNRLNPQNEANWKAEDSFEEEGGKKKKGSKDKKKRGWLKKLKGGGGSSTANTSASDLLGSKDGEGVETRGMVVREVADKLIIKVYLEKEGYSGASTISVSVDAKAPVVRKVAGDRLHVDEWRDYGLYLQTPEGTRKIKRTEKLSSLASKYKADAPFKVCLRPWDKVTSDDTLDDDFAEEDFD